MQPSTSAIPTSAPSLTGLIASLDITKIVTSPLSDIEINDIALAVIDSFDVTESQVDTSGNPTFFK